MKTLKYLIHTLLFLSLLSGLNACTQSQSPQFQASKTTRESLFQVATLQSLMAGCYDSYISVGELRQKGDWGIGTFANINGEMIVIDGTVYQALSDGSVQVANDTTGVPFATVTYFDNDIEQDIPCVDSLTQLAATLDTLLQDQGSNLIYAIRMNVKCKHIGVRSEEAQTPPFKPLAETLATAQRSYDYDNLNGTLIALRFPNYYATLNTSGWHFHFLSDNKQQGGHVTNLVLAQPSKVQIDITPYIQIYMPSQESFNSIDLSHDWSKEIQDVEH